MTTQTADLRNAILQEAALNQGSRYLISHHSQISKDETWQACNELVNDGLAQWDRYSSFSPCIRLTSSALEALGGPS